MYLLQHTIGVECPTYHVDGHCRCPGAYDERTDKGMDPQAFLCSQSCEEEFFIQSCLQDDDIIPETQQVPATTTSATVTTPRIIEDTYCVDDGYIEANELQKYLNMKFQEDQWERDQRQMDLKFAPIPKCPDAPPKKVHATKPNYFNPDQFVLPTPLSPYKSPPTTRGRRVRTQPAILRAQKQFRQMVNTPMPVPLYNQPQQPLVAPRFPPNFNDPKFYDGPLYFSNAEDYFDS